ncbi:MAG: arginine--tRNA ligase [Candidatus Magasanikbacteria bacterium]|nr:arginine--tRNA ligase [Candidatus Magasanikbacteria bacterium]
MIAEIKKQIAEVLANAGVTAEIELSAPPKSEMGDFAFGCFALAKTAGKNPAEVASDLAQKITEAGLPEIVSAIKAFGPYVNFFLNTGVTAELILSGISAAGEKYGQLELGKGKKVMIEYPSQNTHKEFHIGHLRNVCIGNTLVELFRAGGYDVKPVNYINDFGSHVAKCLWGIQHFYAGKVLSENKQKWLGEVYAEASIFLEENPDHKPEVEALQLQLEAHDSKIWDLFEQTRQWSLAGFEDIQKELGCGHKTLFLESDVKARGQELVDELLQKGIAKVGDGGAIIIDLSGHNLDIALLRKSSGAGLYLTSDLALAEKKFGSHDITESINVTGIEQNFYFKQLFKVLELNGFAHKMTHIGYGLVTLPEGKMSSRRGNVILYEDLRDDIFAYMEEEVGKRHTDWSEEKVDEVATVLTQAILKFTMQKHEAAKTIAFNFAEAVSFEGFSAPYLLYTIARINSILRKQEIKPGSGKFLVEAEEKNLVLKLAIFPEIVQKALADYNPSTLTNYTFEVAQAFSSFYHLHSIKDAENPEIQAARVVLIKATHQVITRALSLLTIRTVEEM